MAGVVGLTLVGCGGGASHSRSASTSAARSEATIPRPGHHHARRHRRRHPALDPGTLPQIYRVGSSRTPTFHAEMQSLWTAVFTGHSAEARDAFFPETAYAQVKSIGDAAADWESRLYADYRLDIDAAHALLGTAPASTHLIGVSVPEQYAHWVAPGACLNRVGYYEVPNARMVYRENGQVRSFGIASMISWRGRWYVIHLGYVGKLSIGGRIDDPSAGPGVSAPSSTC